MSTYFIPAVSGEQRRRLSDGLIAFFDITIAEEFGVILDEAYFEQALVILEAKIKSEAESSYDGVIRVEIKPKKSAEKTTGKSGKKTADDTASPPARPSGWDQRQAVAAFKALPPSLQLRARFVDECCKCMTGTLLSMDNDPNLDAEGKLKGLRKQLEQQVRATKTAERKLLRNEGFTMEVFGEEYDNLYMVPKVKDVRVEKGVIVVMTEVLYARGREIGAFRIELNPSEGAPRWFNQTRLVTGIKPGMQAPHVWPSGNACLGNTAEAFSQLFSRRQWAIAAAYAIEFMETANVNDTAGKYINKWPAAGHRPTLAPKSLPTDDAHKQHRIAYMKACAARIGEVTALAKEEIVAQRCEIERLDAAIIQLIRAKWLAKRRKNGLKLCDREAFASELVKLSAVPKVLNVFVEPGLIKFQTDLLHCSDPRTKLQHELGQFAIGIYLDGRGDCLRWVNQTRRIAGCLKVQQAPQVLASGRACLSEIRESFHDLIANLQLSVVAELAIGFIEQVNVDEPCGEFIIKWPLAS